MRDQPAPDRPVADEPASDEPAPDRLAPDDPADDPADPWTAAAAEWALRWGGLTGPARGALLDATAAGPGTRLLDVGCGTGELLVAAAARGAATAGVDAAPAMVARARRAAPAADVRVGGAADLPWGDGTVDVVAMVNLLHLVDDPAAVLAEAARVLAPGGLLAVCGWAERERCELDEVEAALVADDGEEPEPASPLRSEGPLRALLAASGLEPAAGGLVAAPWTAADDDALVRGLLLGEDAAGLADRGPVVLRAAAPHRDEAGGYRFRNALRLVVARRPR